MNEYKGSQKQKAGLMSQKRCYGRLVDFFLVLRSDRHHNAIYDEYD